MTSARVAVAARPESPERRPTRTSNACRARVPPRRKRPAQRRPAGRGLSVVRRRRQGVLGTCLLHGIGLPTCTFAVGHSPLTRRILRIRTCGGYTIAQPNDLGETSRGSLWYERADRIGCFAPPPVRSLTRAF